MTFLNPIGWSLLALAPVLVLLYLRRIRRREVTFSTLMFWRRALGESMHCTWHGRLRQWFSLLLHLLILLLGVLALVRPEPHGPGQAAPAAHSTVLILDARARMQAVEPDGEARFSKALKLVRQTVALAREGAGVALLAARPAPEVISPFCTDPAALSERLSGLTATDAGGDLAPTLALARDLARTTPGKCRILLITDASAPAAGDMETVGVGSSLDNVAITRFSARSQIASPQTADLLLEVANFGRASVRGNVEISSDGTLLDVKPFDLGPGARKTEVFAAVPREGSGRLTARLDVADALALDNTAYALLPRDEPCRVLLVTKGNWFLEKLLASDPTVRFELLAPDAFEPEMARSFDAVIYDNLAAETGLKTLDAVVGNALFVKSSPLGSTGSLDQPPVSDSDADSPLLRLVQWHDVTFLRADRVTVPALPGWKFDAPLRSVDCPLIVAGRQLAGNRQDPAGDPARTEQRMVVFAFDVADSDLPMRVAFPLLISNTVHWLAHSESETAGLAECGHAVVLAAHEIAQPEPDSAAASGVSGGSTPLRQPRTITNAAHGIGGSFQPLRNGFYRIDQTGAAAESHRWLAVNTANDAESNLQSSAATPSTGHGFVPRSLARITSGALWQWFALAAFALLTGEWWLFHRRRTE